MQLSVTWQSIVRSEHQENPVFTRKGVVLMICLFCDVEVTESKNITVTETVTKPDVTNLKITAKH